MMAVSSLDKLSLVITALVIAMEGLVVLYRLTVQDISCWFPDGSVPSESRRYIEKYCYMTAVPPPYSSSHRHNQLHHTPGAVTPSPGGGEAGTATVTRHVTTPAIHYTLLAQVMLWLVYLAYVTFITYRVTPIVTHLQWAISKAMHKVTDLPTSSSPGDNGAAELAGVFRNTMCSPETSLDLLLLPYHRWSLLATTYPAMHFLLAGAWYIVAVLTLHYKDTRAAVGTFGCLVTAAGSDGVGSTISDTTCIVEQSPHVLHVLYVSAVVLAFFIGTLHFLQVMCFAQVCCCSESNAVWWTLIERHGVLSYLPAVSRFSMIALAIVFISSTETATGTADGSTARCLDATPGSSQPVAAAGVGAHKNRCSVLSNDSVFQMGTRRRAYANCSESAL